MCVVEERWSFVANNLSKRRVGETVFQNGAGQMIIGSKSSAAMLSADFRAWMMFLRFSIYPITIEPVAAGVSRNMALSSVLLCLRR